MLLRGVNVGGNNLVPMAALREVLTDAGHRHVRTYVQSGNVVLTTRSSAASVATGVHGAIATSFGLDITVIVRTAAQLADIATHNPFLRPDAHPGRQLHVAFLSAVPTAAAVAALDPHRAAPDELRVRGSAIYLWCPDGMARTKVMTGVERALGAVATVRNWRTVTELARLTADPP